MGEALLMHLMSDGGGDSQITPTFYKYIYSNSATLQTIDLSVHDGWQFIFSVAIYPSIGQVSGAYGYITFTPSDSNIQAPLYQLSTMYESSISTSHKIWAYTSNSLYYVCKTSSDALGHYLTWVVTVGS